MKDNITTLIRFKDLGYEKNPTTDTIKFKWFHVNIEFASKLPRVDFSTTKLLCGYTRNNSPSIKIERRKDKSHSNLFIGLVLMNEDKPISDIHYYELRKDKREAIPVSIKKIMQIAVTFNRDKNIKDVKERSTVLGISEDHPLMQKMAESYENDIFTTNEAHLSDITEPLRDMYPFNLYCDIRGIGKKNSAISLINLNPASLIFQLYTLTPREQSVIHMKYCLRCSTQEIASYFERSTKRINDILSKALRKLRHPSRARYYDSPEKFINKQLEEEVKYLKKELESCRKELLNKREATSTLAESISNEEYSKQFAEIPEIYLETAGMSVRLYNCLKRRGYRTLNELNDVSISEVIKIRNLGRGSLIELIEILDNHTIRLHQDIDLMEFRKEHM